MAPNVSSPIENIELAAYVGASPAVLNGRLYVGTFENEVLCLDLKERQLAWRYQHPKRHFPFFSSAAVTEDVVVVGGRDKMVHALEAETGRQRWVHVTRSRVDSSPVILGERVFVADESGVLLALDLASGKVLWEYETGSPLEASPSVGKGRLVIGTVDGTLFCFGKK